MIRLPVLVALTIALLAPAALARETKSQPDGIKSQPEAIKLTPAEAVKAAKGKGHVQAMLLFFDETHPRYRVVFAKGPAVMVDATNGQVLTSKKRDEGDDDDDDDE